MPAASSRRPVVVGLENGWELGLRFCVLKSLAISVAKMRRRLERYFGLYEGLLTWRP
ncbi:hypothetical protein Gohar_012170 [Gossypium harknessii]|uniref:Uncharacterized protein n=1 Tax=Gossypium harknessii TaxID=34285 RepID=A0A7J9GW60_9ROSI|nr:hypothetical protein [Gossypium harknessii]